MKTYKHIFEELLKEEYKATEKESQQAFKERSEEQ